MRKRSWLIVLVVFVVLGVFMVIFWMNSEYKWTPLLKMKQYESVFDYPIKKISLRKSITSPEWAVLDDEDLLLLWKDYLENIEVKRESVFRNHKNSQMNGDGMVVVVVTTESGEFSIGLYDIQKECKIELDGRVYAVNNGVACPFDTTYNEAIKRHGIVTPWD